MKLSPLLGLVLLATLAACAPAPCDCDAASAVSTGPGADVPSHPLKGVVQGILADRSSLLVKHEEVPGVMRAMTMVFKVEPAVLKQVKQGDAIEARMSRRADGWWLDQVRVVPPKGR